MREVIRTAETARKLAVVGDIYSILVSGEETGGAVCVMENIVGIGGGPPPHTHSREDELFYVLEGEVTFEVEGKTMVAKPGTSVFAPRGQRHRFFNASGKPAKMLVTLMPAGLERMFVEVAMPMGQEAMAAPAPTPEHIETVMKAAPRYGITIAV